MKKAKAGTFKKVLSYMKRYIPVLVFSLVLSVITVALTLYFPILTGRAIDLIVGKGDVDFAAMKVILLKAAVVVVIAAFAQWLTNICNNRMTYNIVRDIRHDAFLNIEKMPLSYIDSHSHGDMVSRIIADVDTFSDGLLMGFTQLFTGIATIIGTLIFMLTIDVKISIVVVLITPLSLFVASFITKKTYSMFQLQTKTRGEQTALIDEVIGNQKVVQAFNHEDESLPFGTLRLKGKGSDAGHNGLKHIAATLGTQDYARLRFGIGNDFPRGGQIDFVLGHFTDEDLKTMDERVATACDIIKSFCLAGISITMNQYNKK